MTGKPVQAPSADPVYELIKLLREGWLTTYERGQYADALASHFADMEAERDRLQLILADLNPDGGSKGFSGGA